jgi:nucleotide-binding universal stress UspA family protein
MKIRNILYPTDFSKLAGRSLPHAEEMATRFRSQITVLHVQVPYADDPGHPHYFFFNEDQYATYVGSQLKLIVDKVGCPISTVVAHDVSPAAGILHYLEGNHVDAVVIGSHGRSALGRFFLGSVAEKVMRHARCPVLTVACQRENCRNNSSFRKILAAFDFSDYSMEAIRQAKSFAQKYEATLQVVYVHSQQIEPGFQRISKKGFKGHLPELVAVAEGTLRKVLREEGLGDLHHHVAVTQGNERASEGIVKFAEETSADLIVMGRHGLTGIANALLGSTTERVVRTAPCPVLTIHKEGGGSP